MNSLSPRRAATFSVAVLLLIASALPARAADGFVTRNGNRLTLEGKPFRFAGGNLDYLALASDSMGRYGVTDMYQPSHFMIDDAFATLQKMGGRVSRIWSTGSQGCAICVEPRLGEFNQNALRQLDYIVDSAARHHIRVIFLFVDPWGFYNGGRVQYEKWRNGHDNFYTDPQLIADYEQYVSTLIHRKNSINGKVYRDDPAILGWQAGNELDAPIEWQRTVSTYIKSQDPNHLLVSSCSLMHGDKLAACASVPEVDLVDVHYYPYLKVPWKLDEDLAIAKNAGKAFMVGEFGWDRLDLSIGQLKANLHDLETNPDISGDMFWALRAHKAPGVFMPVPTPGDNGLLDGSNWSPGKAADGRWWALYYPGRSTGKNTAEDMRQRVRILVHHAAIMSGIAPPKS